MNTILNKWLYQWFCHSIGGLGNLQWNLFTSHSWDRKLGPL